MPDSSVSTSVSILVDVAVGAYMVEKVLRVFLMKAVSDIAVMITKTIIYTHFIILQGFLPSAQVALMYSLHKYHRDISHRSM